MHLSIYEFSTLSISFFRVLPKVFHWFLMSSSVRPTIFSAIFDHLFFSKFYMANKTHSSSALHMPFLRSGLRWFFHRLRHYFAQKKFNSFEIYCHFEGPYLLMNLSNWASALSFQLFLESLVCISAISRLNMNLNLLKTNHLVHNKNLSIHSENSK